MAESTSEDLNNKISPEKTRVAFQYCSLAERTKDQKFVEFIAEYNRLRRTDPRYKDLKDYNDWTVEELDKEEIARLLDSYFGDELAQEALRTRTENGVVGTLSKDQVDAFIESKVRAQTRVRESTRAHVENLLDPIAKRALEDFYKGAGIKPPENLAEQSKKVSREVLNKIDPTIGRGSIRDLEQLMPIALATAMGIIPETGISPSGSGLPHSRALEVARRAVEESHLILEESYKPIQRTENIIQEAWNSPTENKAEMIGVYSQLREMYNDGVPDDYVISQAERLTRIANTAEWAKQKEAEWLVGKNDAEKADYARSKAAITETAGAGHAALPFLSQTPEATKIAALSSWETAAGEVEKKMDAMKIAAVAPAFFPGIRKGLPATKPTTSSSSVFTPKPSSQVHQDLIALLALSAASESGNASPLFPKNLPGKGIGAILHPEIGQTKTPIFSAPGPGGTIVAFGVQDIYYFSFLHSLILSKEGQKSSDGGVGQFLFTLFQVGAERKFAASGGLNALWTAARARLGSQVGVVAGSAFAEATGGAIAGTAIPIPIVGNIIGAVTAIALPKIIGGIRKIFNWVGTGGFFSGKLKTVADYFSSAAGASGAPKKNPLDNPNTLVFLLVGFLALFCIAASSAEGMRFSAYNIGITEQDATTQSSQNNGQNQPSNQRPSRGWHATTATNPKSGSSTSYYAYHGHWGDGINCNGINPFPNTLALTCQHGAGVYGIADVYMCKGSPILAPFDGYAYSVNDSTGGVSLYMFPTYPTGKTTGPQTSDCPALYFTHLLDNNVSGAPDAKGLVPVTQGQVIGHSDCTGTCQGTNEHVHFAGSTTGDMATNVQADINIVNLLTKWGSTAPCMDYKPIQDLSHTDPAFSCLAHNN
jgi:hypothetical protein